MSVNAWFQQLAAIGLATIAPMMRKWSSFCVAQAVVLAATISHSQDSSNKSAAPNWNLVVEIKTDKNTYLPNEPVYFRAVLRNAGKTAVYISKSFFQAGGGIAGFYLSVKQLTGKTSRSGCVVAGDRLPTPDPRAPEQILREDYLRLPPGGIVGFESQYDGCVVKYPGTYEIDSMYSAQDLNVGKVRILADKAEAIVTGQFRSEPTKFRVRDK